jgi:hypothetical protein
MLIMRKVLGDEFGSKDLHVPCEYDQIHILTQQLKHLALGLALVRGVGQQVEWDLIKSASRWALG